MRIWTLGEILETEHLGHERYILDSEMREQEQKWALESLEQSKEISRLKARVVTLTALMKGLKKGE